MSGTHIAHAARRRRQRRELEEEAMTPYTPQDLDRWEFKIIRGSFHDPEYTTAVLDQEALAGWKLVETFDPKRLRLKRQMDARRQDAVLLEGLDPYRTRYGPAGIQTGLVIAGTLMALLLAAGLLAVFLS
jgi:hypothetical protein